MKNLRKNYWKIEKLIESLTRSLDKAITRTTRNIIETLYKISHINKTHKIMKFYNENKKIYNDVQTYTVNITTLNCIKRISSFLNVYISNM